MWKSQDHANRLARPVWPPLNGSMWPTSLAVLVSATCAISFPIQHKVISSSSTFPLTQIERSSAFRFRVVPTEVVLTEVPPVK